MASGASQVSGTTTFAELLRRHRIAAALSQEALAERAGLSARAISDLERGVKTRPYLETVRMLADALDLTLPDRTELARAARPQASLFPGEQPEWKASGLRGVIPLAAQTSLVGRDNDIAQIAKILLREDLRLVTLIGPGGVGKTRLALAVAKAIRADFPDGVWFIDLTAVSDPALVPSAIVQALGLSEVGGTPILNQLVAFLRGKRALLVLDNFEHVIAAAPAIAELIRQDAIVKILVTSRMPLHISGEQEVPIEPLLLPDLGAVQFAAIRDIPAIELFVQRAQTARPGFALTSENAAAVAGICRRLDGLPLAIELAAARIKLLSPRSLLERLDNVLPLLTSGPIDRPDRHRALHATIAWSYDLLDEAEQSLFRRLSVFRGGCTFESAEAVCNYDGSLDILGGIASLLDKSLLHCEGDEPRFRMLETIREFAQDQLRSAAEMQPAEQALVSHFSGAAAEFRYQMDTPGRGKSLERTVTEIGNIRAAIDAAHRGRDSTAAQALVSGFASLWMDFGHFVEAREKFSLVLSLDGADPETRVNALYWASVFETFPGGNLDLSRSYADESLLLALQSDYRFGTANAKFALGAIALARDNDVTAEALLKDALATLSDLDGPPWVAATQAHILGWLGMIAHRSGDLPRAAASYEQSLFAWRSIDHPYGVPLVLNHMAELAQDSGNVPRALELAIDAIQRNFAERNELQVAYGLLYIAGLFLDLEDCVASARIISAARKCLEALRIALGAETSDGLQTDIQRIRAKLDPAEFERECHRGMMLSDSEAVIEAVSLAHPLLQKQGNA